MGLSSKNESDKLSKNGTTVNNAGIVLLNNYIMMLFQRLDFVSNHQFTSKENQIKAAQYLQYIVTGSSHTEETFLSLNKVLCGLSVSDSIPDEIQIPEENKKLINGLIEAVINYWPSIGHCSIDGFRGNWLVRDGVLVELEGHWDLAIQKRAYDILLNKAPFTFSIIKFPWMNKPLHVMWP